MRAWRNGWFFGLDPDGSLRIEIRQGTEQPATGYTVMAQAVIPRPEWIPLFGDLGVKMDAEVVESAKVTPAPQAAPEPPAVPRRESPLEPWEQDDPDNGEDEELDDDDLDEDDLEDVVFEDQPGGEKHPKKAPKKK